MGFESNTAERPASSLMGMDGAPTLEACQVLTREAEANQARLAQREDNRALIAEVLYHALRHGASAPELRESFKEGLFDAVRRIRNEDGLTVNQAAKDYGVRRNDLASTDVDDQLDVAILRVAMRVVTLIQTQGVKSSEGMMMTHAQIQQALDADRSGLWTTLVRTYPRDALRHVVERVLKSNGAWEPTPGVVAVEAKSFFPPTKLGEAIPYAHFSVGEYLSVVSGVVREMKSAAYRAGLRLRQAPRTKDAAYASLTIKWRGDARSLVDALREVAQGATDEGQTLNVIVGARMA